MSFGFWESSWLWCMQCCVTVLALSLFSALAELRVLRTVVASSRPLLPTVLPQRPLFNDDAPSPCALEVISGAWNVPRAIAIELSAAAERIVELWISPWYIQTVPDPGGVFEAEILTALGEIFGAAAARSSRLRVVEWLLEDGAVALRASADSTSPLHPAVACGAGGEIAHLRAQSALLVDALLPGSPAGKIFSGSRLTATLLREILAARVLAPLVNVASDTHSLNEALLAALSAAPGPAAESSLTNESDPEDKDEVSEEDAVAAATEMGAPSIDSLSHGVLRHEGVDAISDDSVTEASVPTIANVACPSDSMVRDDFTGIMESPVEEDSSGAEPIPSVVIDRLEALDAPAVAVALAAKFDEESSMGVAVQDTSAPIIDDLSLPVIAAHVEPALFTWRSLWRARGSRATPTPAKASQPQPLDLNAVISEWQPSPHGSTYEYEDISDMEVSLRRIKFARMIDPSSEALAATDTTPLRDLGSRYVTSADLSRSGTESLFNGPQNMPVGTFLFRSRDTLEETESSSNLYFCFIARAGSVTHVPLAYDSMTLAVRVMSCGTVHESLLAFLNSERDTAVYGALVSETSESSLPIKESDVETSGECFRRLRVVLERVRPARTSRAATPLPAADVLETARSSTPPPMSPQRDLGACDSTPIAAAAPVAKKFSESSSWTRALSSLTPLVFSRPRAKTNEDAPPVVDACVSESTVGGHVNIEAPLDATIDKVDANVAVAALVSSEERGSAGAITGEGRLCEAADLSDSLGRVHAAISVPGGSPNQPFALSGVTYAGEEILRSSEVLDVPMIADAPAVVDSDNVITDKDIAPTLADTAASAATASAAAATTTIATTTTARKDDLARSGLVPRLVSVKSLARAEAALFDLFSDVFSLQSRGWLLRGAAGVMRAIASLLLRGPASRSLTAAYDAATRPVALARVLRSVRLAVLPLSSGRQPVDPQVAAATAAATQVALQRALPGTLISLLGREEADEAVSRAYATLNEPNRARSLVFSLLDALILRLCAAQADPINAPIPVEASSVRALSPPAEHETPARPAVRQRDLKRSAAAAAPPGGSPAAIAPPLQKTDAHLGGTANNGILSRFAIRGGWFSGKFE